MSNLENLITPEKILKVLSDEWQSLDTIILKLKIRENMDALFVQVKLKLLERQGKVLSEVILGKKYWKLHQLKNLNYF